jgi:hypothetical protein
MPKKAQNVTHDWRKQVQIIQKLSEDGEQRKILKNILLWWKSHICIKQNGVQYVRKYDYEDWDYETFRK